MFFSLKGYFSFITSRELAWGTMTRQGFDSDEDKKKKKQEERDRSGTINDDDNTTNDRNAKAKKPSILDRLKRKKKSVDFDPTKT